MAHNTFSRNFIIYVLATITVITEYHPSSSFSVKWVVPTCCETDEILLPPKWECQPALKGSQVIPWTPSVFLGREEHNRNVQVNYSLDKVIFNKAYLPQACSAMSADKARHMGSSVNWFFTFPVTIKDTRFPMNHIKLIKPPGGIQGVIKPLIFNRSRRRWKYINSTHFCVEPVYSEQQTQNGSIVYSVENNEFVMVLCKDGGRVKKSNPSSLIFGWYNFTVSVIGAAFLLLNIIVYTFLGNSMNLHGLTILSFSVVALGTYLLNGAIFRFWPYERVIRGINVMGPSCYFIALLSHYFLLSTFLWLTIMNFNLWITFRSIQIVRKESSKWMKYCLYSLAGWILPLLLVSTFVIVDIVYSDLTTEVAVPSYATFHCSVSPFFNMEYVLIPKLVVLVINLVLIGLTLKIFIGARTRSNTTFSGALAYENQYNAAFFTKLFIVMGLGWTTLSLGYALVWIWFYKQNESTPPLIVTAVHNFLYMCLFVLFAVFCLNDRVRGQLVEKYSCLGGVGSKARKLFRRKGSVEGDSSGTSCSDLDDYSLHALDSERMPLRKPRK